MKAADHLLDEAGQQRRSSDGAAISKGPGVGRTTQRRRIAPPVHGIGRPDADITTILDVSAFRDLRERAVAAHRSQRSPMADMPEHLVEAFVSTDRLVRVQPPWSGGEQERSLL